MQKSILVLVAGRIEQFSFAFRITRKKKTQQICNALQFFLYNAIILWCHLGQLLFSYFFVVILLFINQVLLDSFVRKKVISILLFLQIHTRRNKENLNRSSQNLLELIKTN